MYGIGYDSRASGIGGAIAGHRALCTDMSLGGKGRCSPPQICRLGVKGDATVLHTAKNWNPARPRCRCAQPGSRTYTLAHNKITTSNNHVLCTVWTYGIWYIRIWYTWVYHALMVYKPQHHQSAWHTNADHTTHLILRQCKSLAQ